MINICGVEIDDIKTAEDVFLAMEYMRAGIENIEEELKKDLEAYKQIPDVTNDIKNLILLNKKLMSQNLDVSKEMNSINDTIQNSINTQNRALFNSLIDFKNEAGSLTDNLTLELNNKIESAVNSIDLKKFENLVENLFKEKSASLIAETVKLDKNNINFKNINNDLNTLLKQTNSNIKNSVENFNNLTAELKQQTILLALTGGFFVGAVIGGLAMMFFLK